MRDITTITYQVNDYLVNPGRYIGKLVDVAPVPEKPGQIKMKFHIPKQGSLHEDKKATKLYTDAYPMWLKQDLESWLGKDEFAALFPDGCSMHHLKRLIGREAVLVIVNKEMGRPNPLVCIEQILPALPRYLEETTPASIQELTFRWPVTPKTSSGRATAA
jgi:hypothetical protein